MIDVKEDFAKSLVMVKGVGREKRVQPAGKEESLDGFGFVILSSFPLSFSRFLSLFMTLWLVSIFEKILQEFPL